MRERIEHARRLTSVTDLCADSARLGLPPSLSTHTEAHRVQCSKLVELRGLEPPRVAPQAPQACVYCHFTTTPRRWCRGRDLNPQSVKARDFKSRMYASSTTPADFKENGARFCVFKAFLIAVWAPEKHAGLGETPIGIEGRIRTCVSPKGVLIRILPT